MTVHFEQSRRYDGVDQETAFSVVIAAQLPEVFARRTGPIPRITDVEDDGVAWGSAVGQTRTVRLADGGAVLETLTVLNPPRSFTYTLTEIRGPMRVIASRVAGTFEFESAGEDTDVTWVWDVEPSAPLAAPLLPVFGLFWKRHAAHALAKMEAMIDW